eukprot:CAMPEP_0174921926 /NCGR_PEP_ID=MMETSP1355-20121228/5501_1 /TAXON_ID=464990 /ORGANISM="Hemiselmis tepida, Strain CCMP443" /LENGTH=65 /DNA_ID=CAMNT_0016167457 /DNA_START=40 /DNA_END=234 /DNA_ORIENTATION=-
MGPRSSLEGATQAVQRTASVERALHIASGAAGPPPFTEDWLEQRGLSPWESAVDLAVCEGAVAWL